MSNKLTGKDKFLKFKTVINLIILFLKIFPKKILICCWNLINNWKGILGVVLRYCLVKVLAQECGDNVFIDANVEIKNIHKIKIGSNVSIHRFCYIDGVGGLEIGNDVSIAHSTSLITFEHTWQDNTLPIKYNPLLLKSITIEDDIWIGCGCRILGGTHISTRAIIAAGAVVNCDVDSNCIYGGIPAKCIKKL